MIIPDIKIIIWGILAGVSVAFVIIFILVRRIGSLGKVKTSLKSLFVTAFLFVVIVVSSYSLMLFLPVLNNIPGISNEFTGGRDISDIGFPSTGSVKVTDFINLLINDLFGTPMDGLTTIFFLAFIFYISVKIIKPDNRQIEQDLKDAKIAARNVLEDLQAERLHLAEVSAKNEAILASIGEGIIAFDKMGNIILMNGIAEKIIGWSEAEIKGKNVSEIIRAVDSSGLDVPEADLILPNILKHGSTMSVATNYKRKDGSIVPVAVKISPILVGDEITGAVEVFRDTSKELALDKAKNEFISIASHQLRTPVAGLSWVIESLQFTSQNLTLKQKKYITDLSMLTKRLVGLVEDLLNISKIELKAESMIDKTVIDIPNFIASFIKEIKPFADLKKHTIIFNNKTGGPLTVELNKKSLYYVLQNLVSNGVEYSPADTTVTINLEKTDTFIKVSVLNEGSVIPKHEQAELFGKFYRGETGKKMKVEGTGLGLYIVKMIIEGLGGKVGLESPARMSDGHVDDYGSKEKKDTVFWIMIPLNITINK